MPQDVTIHTHITNISKHHLEVVIIVREIGSPIGVYIILSHASDIVKSSYVTKVDIYEEPISVNDDCITYNINLFPPIKPMGLVQFLYGPPYLNKVLHLCFQ